MTASANDPHGHLLINTAGMSADDIQMLCDFVSSLGGDKSVRSVIATLCGRFVDPFDLDPEEIDLVTIAHALAQANRFAGHGIRPYTVAQHSCLLHDFALEAGHGTSVAIGCLMHDATEAYVQDIVRPNKRRIPHFKAIEARAEAVIRQRFDLGPFDPLVHQLDLAICRDEARVLFPSLYPGREHMWGPLEELGIDIARSGFWGFDRAKEEFLRRADLYFPISFHNAPSSQAPRRRMR